MKTTPIVFLFILFLDVSQTFGQYTPLVKENKFWIYVNYESNDLPKKGSGHLIHFENDTTLNNILYKKVYKQELKGTHPCPMGQMPCFVFDFPLAVFNKKLIGFIREDLVTLKVYFISAIGTYCDENEYLLFDFSLNVNETLDDCKKVALGGHSNYGNVDSITTNLIYGLNRTVYHSFGLVSYIGLSYEGVVNIIEGIGFDRHGLFHRVSNLSELYDFCEGSLSDCNIVSNAIETTLGEIKPIYPNPSEGLIYIDKNISIYSLKIIRMNGEEILIPDQGNYFDVSEFQNGIYILEVVATDGNIYRSRFVKN